MHLAGGHHLPLRRVPDVLVRLCVLELLKAVLVLARIGRVFLERLARPAGGARQVVIL